MPRIYIKHQALEIRTDFDGIKRGYHTGPTSSENRHQILAKGPDLSIWIEPHDRDRFSK